MHLTLWKSVAKNWRELEDTVEKLSIVQKVTSKAIGQIDHTASVIANIDDWETDPFDGEDEFEIT